MIGELLKGVLGELYLTDEQRLAAPEIVRRHLKLMSPWQSPWPPDEQEESS
jgi:hypothetical protein